MRGEHEIEAARAHRIHQRQHIAAGHAEAVADAGGFEYGDDQIGVAAGGGEGFACRLAACALKCHNALAN